VTNDDTQGFAALFERGTTAGQRGTRRVRTGETIDALVVSVGRDAVFVELGGKQEGVLERAALEGDDGELLVKVGDRVTARVRQVDSETGQARLVPVVVRAPNEAPKTVAAASDGPALAEGARVKGAITGVERFGVFVQVAGTRGGSGRGLVPTAELGVPRGADLRKHFAVGQEVEAKIVSMADGRMKLSFVALKADEERADFDKHRKEAATPRSPRSLGTLGDLLAKASKARR
jgi:small subunit ribosomal protein S1